MVHAKRRCKSAINNKIGNAPILGGSAIFARTLLANALVEARKLRPGEFSRLRRRFRDLQQSESTVALLLNHLLAVRQLTRGRSGYLTRHAPSLTSKYAGPYLGISLNHVQRRRICLFHHAFLSERLNDDFFHEVVQPRAPIWSMEAGPRSHAIWLQLNRALGGEGDLSLIFATDGAPLCELSFTFGPSRPGTDDAAMLIARIQGARGQLDAIRQATKDYHDVAPAHLLLAAAEGVAMALSVRKIRGVSNEEQLSKAGPEKDGCCFDYDAFWAALPGRWVDGWRELQAPIGHKPLAEISVDHRRRTLRKRRLKDAIRDHIAAAVTQRFILWPRQLEAVSSAPARPLQLSSAQSTLGY
jgi:hypothetical protein